MSKKYIILKLRELERDLEALRKTIKEYYGYDENIDIYLDLTKSKFKHF